ncbi:MAG: UbiA-like protein EboC [Saprospiraceae bacterium]|nr:UbiA-like protein EboC [Saprospiraceae bacterium]
MNIFPYLVLTRPANVITAISDIIAGLAIAGVLTDMDVGKDLPEMLFLMFSTAGLYAGGIVFNDIFDLEIDRVDRPERILPSGKITLRNAVLFGMVLLLGGVLMAFLVSTSSGLIALTIAFFALLYDKYGKHHPLFGPLNMGMCRGLNLLLGMSIVALTSLSVLWLMSLLPIVFVAAVTLTSRGEVTARNQQSIRLALTLDVLVAATILVLGFYQILNLPMVIPFVILWLGMNLSAKMKAIRQNEPAVIMKAVKIGVISLIPLNASYVAGFGHWIFALAMLMLLPLTLLLSRRFAVT